MTRKKVTKKVYKVPEKKPLSREEKLTVGKPRRDDIIHVKDRKGGSHRIHESDWPLWEKAGYIK